MMRVRTMQMLAGAAVATAISAMLFAGGGEPVRTEIAAGRPMFPMLNSQLERAQRIEILHQGRTLAIARSDGGWVLPEHADYPVQQQSVRSLFMSLAALRLEEQRTSDPAAFARLGLDNPASAEAASTSVRVLETDATPIASVITGNVPVEAAAPYAIYLRKPDETCTWLASGWLGASVDWHDWIEPTIVDVLPETVVAVTSQRAGEPLLELTRRDGKLALTIPADHPPLDSYKLDDMARSLSALELLDVVRAADVPGTAVGDAVLQRDDGLKLRVQMNKAGEDVWMRLSAEGSDEAELLQARLSPWAFRVPASKERALLPTLAYLTAFSFAAMPPPATPISARQGLPARNRRK